MATAERFGARLAAMGAGATHLTAEQRRALEHDGYVVIPSLVDEAILGQIAHRLKELVRRTVATWALDPRQDTHEGAVYLDIDLADPDFAACHEHPLLADAADVVLGPDWRVSGLNVRAPIPGCGHQGLHQDFEERRPGKRPWQVLAAMWCVSPFGPDNGTLRVVRGSHQTAEPPIDTEHGYATGMGPHPDEVKVVAPAGSVILFNSADLWHSGTLNYSPTARLAVTAYFSPSRHSVAPPA